MLRGLPQQKGWGGGGVGGQVRKEEERAKTKGPDILQGGEEATVVCVLKAEGKLLNYR